MIRTETGKYAIRAIVYLAHADGQSEPISAAEIAGAEHIPPYYLAKILQDLVRTGILESVRGRGGGFRLTGSPETVSVFDILQAIEPMERLTEDCILGLECCTDEVPCPLHDLWTEFRDAYVTAVRDVSVADLVEASDSKRAALLAS